MIWPKKNKVKKARKHVAGKGLSRNLRQMEFYFRGHYYITNPNNASLMDIIENYHGIVLFDSHLDSQARRLC